MMEAVMRFSSRHTTLVLAIISSLCTNVALSSSSKMYPEDLPMEPCTLANGKDGICVYGYLCHDSIINIDGNGIIDLRFSDVCEDYFLKCCSKETPCLENAGTCVSANNCGVNLNDPKYKKYQQSDECDWSGYTCCPNDKIGQSNVTNRTDRESCNPNSYCVPQKQCVAPDGGGFTSKCTSREHTCCPEHMITAPGEVSEPESTDIPSNSIEQFETCDDHSVCVLEDQCVLDYGDNIIQARATICDGANLTCCPKDKLKHVDPCNEVGGICRSEHACPESSSLVLDLRISQCEEYGFVCCMQDSTNGRNQFINKTCSGERGKCTPRKQCRGTTYRDRDNECGGLACCATFPIVTQRPTVSTSTTRKPATEENEGKACFHNLGKCTNGSCEGAKYTDRKNECGKLNCCPVIDVSPSTTITVRSCNSVGGQCMQDKDCREKASSSVDDCEESEVCCVQKEGGGPRPASEFVKECGYRNVNGVKFETTGREDGESQFGEFPWMVVIMADENGKTKFVCGGSLIDPEVILTTAACVKSYRRSPDKLIIRAGEWDLGTTREPISHEERRVEKIITHPDYKATSLVNNVALVFLDDKFDLSSTINTVCLPPQNFVIDNGEVTASGWGSTPQDRTKYQQILKSIDLIFVGRHECEPILRTGTKNRNFKLHRSFLCAGGMAGLDTCWGDAGSPITYPVPDDFHFRYYAVGMVSWGIGCGKSGIPAVYTDIAYFRNWIDNVLENEHLTDHNYRYEKYDGDNDLSQQ